MISWQRHLVCFWVGLLIFFSSTAAQSMHIDQMEVKAAKLFVTLEGQAEREVQGVQTLPWRWDEHYVKQRGLARFVLSFNLDSAQYAATKQQSQGLGFGAVNMGNRYRYQINQSGWQLVGWDYLTTQYRAKPKWHAIPADLLNVGLNTLEIEIKMEPANDAGLSKVEVGEFKPSLQRYFSDLAIRNNSMVLVISLALFVSLLGLGMWDATKESFFGWVFLSNACFVSRQLMGFVEYPPVATWIWNASLAILFSLFVGFTFKLGQILVSKPAPSFDKAITVYLWVGVPFLLLGYALDDYRFYRGWLVVMLSLTFLLAGRVTWFAWRTPNLNLRLFALAAWSAFALGFYDLLLVQFAQDGLGRFRMGSYTTLLFNLGLAVIVVRKYSQAQQNFYEIKALAKLESQQAALSERQRIMADIHDTVGAQLTGVFALIQGKASYEQLEAETAEALDGLRAAVDSIQPVDGDLTAVLATLRHRLEPKLERQGIVLLWNMETLPRMPGLSPQFIQHIHRMVLEVIHNVIKHAKARVVSFTASFVPSTQKVVIEIADDGIGFDATKLAATGQGMRTMHYRAQAIGATLAFSQAQPSGTKVTLTLTNPSYP